MEFCSSFITLCRNFKHNCFIVNHYLLVIIGKFIAFSSYGAIMKLTMTSPVLLKAKPIVEDQKSKLIEKCKALRKAPLMKVLLVGKNPASKVYVGHKQKLCREVGADCIVETLSEDVSEQVFLSKVKEINKDKEVHGLIIQLPLPAQLSHLNVSELILPEKDIDGFHFVNTKNIFTNTVNEHTLLPCTPKGILKVLDHYNIAVEGKNVVVLGRSLIVGKPISLLLSNRNATVTICHSRTKNLQEHTKKADILVVAIGKEEFIKAEHLSENQVIIDVGIHKKDDGSLCGDVDFNAALTRNPLAITPVPGGIGPLTVLSLIENLIITAEK